MPHAPLSDALPAHRAERADAGRSLEYARAHARLFPDAGTAWMPLAGGYAVFAGGASPLSKGVGLGTDGAFGVPELEMLEEFYERHHMAAALDLSQSMDAAMVDLLAVRNYAPSYSLNVLVLDIGRHRTAGAALSDFRIRAADIDDEESWVRTVARGFADGDEPGTGDLEIFTTQFHAATSHCFLAEIEETPVGGGLIAIAEGVGLLGAASVLPPYRGRGIHDALLRERLAYAIARGCDLAVTSTTPGSASQRNLERRGFRVLHTRLSMRHDPA